ncbi:N-alpha-acetyl-L-2,4-diaminobutyrate deacetylase [Aestuariispira insulae]|uniref:N-alpha-acetyl-L-2,4-diaminobutyrate deacetylase n=2 Tax=Aestuariispira insulae TaxID=1461337 RepID=A0A3D9H2S2_9PROT|nr:N-alpha-acetyl-L-2,4-diaminobutyrate deacetylase [Aestuariispira insulae]
MNENRPSPITSTVDFQAEGKAHGFLKLPYSHDESAWSNIMIPITVVKNGEGPTALLTGANHGDEYEGPVALHRLAQELEPTHITGTVIIVPAMNYPAFKAGTRTSPIDKGNMNRLFPGRPDGSVTEKIADYFQRFLLPLADYVVDIHAGGKTLDFVPFAAAHILRNKEQQGRCHAAMEAFGAPYSMVLLEMDAVGMYDTAAEEMGKVFVSTELGGGGSSTARSNAIAWRGVRNILVHAGILLDEMDGHDSIRLDMPDAACFITSESNGLFEICVDLGEAVEEGQLIARIHDAERTGTAPTEYRAKRSGILAARHFPGQIKIGDSLAVIAEIVE